MSTENVVLMSKSGDQKRIVENKSREHALAIEAHLEQRFKGTASECLAYKTNGELFKLKHGFSKSLQRSMRKSNLNPFKSGDIDTYKKERKSRRKSQILISKAKHDRALGGRGGSKTIKTKK